MKYWRYCWNWVVAPQWYVDAIAQLFKVKIDGYDGNWSDRRVGATPAIYRESGVMTSIVNYNGNNLQTDRGAKAAPAASWLHTFGWRRLLATSLVIAALPAAAANLTPLKDLPMAKFTEQDLLLFNQTLTEALDSGADGETRQWSNPDTKAEGEIKVLKSFERAALRCRMVTVRNTAKGRTASSNHSLCKQASGKWTSAK